MNSSFKKYASEQYVDEQLGKIHLDWESIQNKPFYEDRSNLVERMTLDSSKWQSAGSIHIYTQYISNDNMIFQPNDQCTVNIDGKDYSGTLTLMSDGKSFVIGDLEKFEAKDVYNIDFLFGFGETTYNRHEMICIFNNGSETAPNQAIVYSGIPDVKQLDEKFIPETPIDWNRLTNVPYVTNKVICEWEQNKIYDTQVPLGDTGNVIYSFTHLSKISSDSFTLNDLNNKKLRVNILINQTTVVDEALTIDITKTDSFNILNDSCADLQFLIVVFADSYTHPNYNTTLTKGVWVPQDNGLNESYIVKKVQLLDDSEFQIKEEFINTQWDNIQGKPFADGSTKYVYDINNTYNEVINFQDFEVYTKISNNTPTKETFYNQVFSVDYLENDKLHHREITLTADNIGELVENTVFGTDGLMIVREPWVTGEELDGKQIIFSPGVWAINVMNGDTFVQHSEVTSIDGNKCILEHFIPDTIARKEDIADLENIETKITNIEATLENVGVLVDDIIESKVDWNQNSETAVDYIKNRTHYIDYATETVIEETTETEMIPILNDTILHDDNYIVTVDGIEYYCQSYTNTTFGDFSLGDSRLLYKEGVAEGAYDMDMTNPVDMPFAVYSAYETPPNGNFFEEIAVAYVYYADDQPHTIKIEKVIGESIHQLDEKFIPDTIARKTDLNNIDLSNFYSKSEIDNMEFITVDDIDTICGTTIIDATETDVRF